VFHISIGFGETLTENEVTGISGVAPGSVGSQVCVLGMCAGLEEVYLESLATTTVVPTLQL
jgi:hypothetical protein